MTISIQIAFIVQQKAQVQNLELNELTSIENALNFLHQQKDFAIQPNQKIGFSIWGKKKSPDYVLQSGDRLEICTELIASPMDSRRRRAKKFHKSKKM